MSFRRPNRKSAGGRENLIRLIHKLKTYNYLRVVNFIARKGIAHPSLPLSHWSKTHSPKCKLWKSEKLCIECIELIPSQDIAK